MVNWEVIYGYFIRGLAEFSGNVMFLGLGCAGAVSTDIYTNTPIQLGFCFGLIVMGIYNTFWIISGAHITPGVTIAALIVKQIDWKNALVYIPCQFLGGFLGCWLAMLLVPDTAYTSIFTNQEICVTVPNYSLGITNAHAFGIEFLTTSAWVFVMLAVWSRPAETVKDNAALQIGFAVVTLTMLSSESTGASMSPARTLAPAVLHGTYDDIWVYFTAPLLAPIFVAVLWKFIYMEDNLRQWTQGMKQYCGSGKADV